MSTVPLAARLNAAVRFAATAFLAALLVVAGWSPARALPTLDLAGQALGAGQAQQGVGRGETPASNWRVRAPGATQLAARPGPPDDLGTAAAPPAALTLRFFAASATLAAPLVGAAAHVPGARRARAPPRA